MSCIGIELRTTTYRSASSFAEPTTLIREAYFSTPCCFSIPAPDQGPALRNATALSAVWVTFVFLLVWWAALAPDAKVHQWCRMCSCATSAQPAVDEEEGLEMNQTSTQWTEQTLE